MKLANVDQINFASNSKMKNPKWTIRIWMMECVVLAGLLSAYPLTPSSSFFAIVIGMVWWLGAFSPNMCNWIGVFLGSGVLVPGAAFLSARHERPGSAQGIFVLVSAAFTVWAIFAFLPLLHLKLLGYFGSRRKKSDEAGIVDL